MIGGSHQVAIDIIYPGELSDEVYERALRNNDEVVAKLGYRFGFTHAEYMVDPQGRPFLIEIANRGGGCYTSCKIVPAVSGLDLTSQLIYDSLGIERDLFEEKGGQDHRAAYLKFFVLPPGRIAQIRGTEAITRLTGIEALRLRVEEGSVVSSTTSDADRHGFVIATADSREQVKSLANQSIDMLKVTYGE
ncbi:argininosuccinate lyase [compost metagenome]